MFYCFFKKLVSKKRTRGKIRHYRIESSEDETDLNEDDTTDGDVVMSSEREADSDGSSKAEESDEDLNDDITMCRNIVEKLMKYQYTDIFR